MGFPVATIPGLFKHDERTPLTIKKGEQGLACAHAGAVGYDGPVHYQRSTELIEVHGAFRPTVHVRWVVTCPACGIDTPLSALTVLFTFEEDVTFVGNT